MRICKTRFYIGKEDEISETKVWVCFTQDYLYTSRTFFGLIKTLITEWKDEKHLG